MASRTEKQGDKPMTATIIDQTNDLVRRAIAGVRIDRNGATMSALYSALTKRRNARDYVMPASEASAWEYMHMSPYYSNMTFAEKSGIVTKHRNVTKPDFEGGA